MGSGPLRDIGITVPHDTLTEIQYRKMRAVHGELTSIYLQSCTAVKEELRPILLLIGDVERRYVKAAERWTLERSRKQP